MIRTVLTGTTILLLIIPMAIVFTAGFVWTLSKHFLGFSWRAGIQEADEAL